MIAATGYRTTIVQELGEPVIGIKADLADPSFKPYVPQVDHFVLAAGVLYSKTILEQSGKEIVDSVMVNCINTVKLCEAIFEQRENAVVCVIGSKSGMKGSYDLTYALGKAAIHSYVEFKQLRPTQRIMAVAPGIIIDSGMTRRRHDYEQIKHLPLTKAKDVAAKVRSLLFNNPVSNVVCPI